MALNKITAAVQAAKAIKSMLPESFYEDMKKYVVFRVTTSHLKDLLLVISF